MLSLIALRIHAAERGSARCPTPHWQIALHPIGSKASSAVADVARQVAVQMWPVAVQMWTGPISAAAVDGADRARPESPPSSVHEYRKPCTVDEPPDTACLEPLCPEVYPTTHPARPP